MKGIFDHVDLRVRDLGVVKPFYDKLLRAFGFRATPGSEGTVVYLRIKNGAVREALAVIADPDHTPNRTRLAFAAESNAEVDRLTAIAQTAGARALEPAGDCPEIAPRYYASFFEDPEGNRLEIVCR